MLASCNASFTCTDVVRLVHRFGEHDLLRRHALDFDRVYPATHLLDVAFRLHGTYYSCALLDLLVCSDVNRLVVIFFSVVVIHILYSTGEE